MTSLPEDQQHDPLIPPQNNQPAASDPDAANQPNPAGDWPPSPAYIAPSGEDDRPADPTETLSDGIDPAAVYHPDTDLSVFRQYEPPPLPPERIPNFGHLCLLGLLVGFGLLVTGIVTQIALHNHLFGISTAQHALSDVHYALGSEALLYLFTLAGCLIVFPMVWHKGFFAGVQWNAATAFRLRWRLLGAAGLCFLLAFIDSVVIPGPKNAPIEKIFNAPGAAWLLFGFGITFAPFFEETFFRGFLLPTLCTAYDWMVEKATHRPRLPLAGNGHPQWSLPALIVGSIATSIPFAAMHGEQTGYSVGPFLLLVAVSLVLCFIRLSTRSLAASTVVHASYNFMLFTIMLVGTHGFRHLEKM
jgi:uncharacterized protein